MITNTHQGSIIKAPLKLSKYILFIALLSSCSVKDNSVQVYKSKKIAAPSSMKNMASMSGQVSSVQNKNLKWENPKGWEVKPTNSIRIGSFKFNSKNNETADISIIILAGEGGGITPNINRWRRQIQLKAISQDEVQQAQKDIQGKIGNYLYFFMKNQSNQKGIIAAIAKHNGNALFVKAMGNLEALKEVETEFLAFVKGINEN